MNTTKNVYVYCPSGRYGIRFQVDRIKKYIVYVTNYYTIYIYYILYKRCRVKNVIAIFEKTWLVKI